VEKWRLDLDAVWGGEYGVGRGMVYRGGDRRGEGAVAREVLLEYRGTRDQ